MANKNSNYPPGQLGALDGKEFVKGAVSSLRELSTAGAPKTLSELKKRIDDYFSFCGDRAFRPGVESMALALGIDRTTFWRWRNGEGCPEEWAETCAHAWQLIIAFVEAVGMSGHLNPAAYCFFMKNNGLGYSDTATLEVKTPERKKALSSDKLPTLGPPKADAKSAEELPVLDRERVQGEQRADNA